METLTNLANQGKIAKLKPFKVKPPSKINALKDAIQQHLQAIRQHFFRQNSMNQDSLKFNNAKVSGFTVSQTMARLMTVHVSQKFIILRRHIKWGEFSVTPTRNYRFIHS